MNEEPTNNKKLYRLVIATLLIILGLAAAYLVITILGSRSSASLSAPFVQNLNNPYKIDAQQLYFFTGNGFASLDATTNKTKQLGQTRTLPKNPSAILWTKNGAVLQAANYTIFDDLGSLIPGQTTPGSKSAYAWYIPFEGAPVVLDKNTSSLYTDSNTGTVYYLWKINPAADGALLRTYSTTTGARQQFMSEGISGSFRIVYAAGDYVWALVGYGKEVSLVKYGRNEPSQTLVNNVFNSDTATVENALVMINESFFVSTQQDGERSALFSYDLNSKAKKVLDSDFTGSINRGSGSAIYASSTKDNKALVRRFTGAQELQTLTATMPEGVLTRGFDWGDNQLVVNLLKQGQLLSTNKTTLQNLSAVKNTGLDKTINRAHQGSLYSVSINLDNAATSNSYSINIYAPYTENTATLFNDIRAAGYDPNQLDLSLNQTVIRQ